MLAFVMGYLVLIGISTVVVSILICNAMVIEEDGLPDRAARPESAYTKKSS